MKKVNFIILLLVFALCATALGQSTATLHAGCTELTGNLPGGLTESTWTGSVDNDWFNEGNWTDGVPIAEIDANIPDVGIASFPLIANSIAVTGALHIYPAAMLTIAPQAGLTTQGLFTNDGFFLIQSDNTSGYAGTFIDHAGISGAGTFEFDRNVICSGTTGGSTDPFGWHFFSSPIDGFTTDDLYDYYINAWDQPNGMWSSYDPYPVYGPCTLWPTTPLSTMDAWSINLNLAYPDPTCIPPLPAGTGVILEFEGPVNQVHTGNYEKVLGFGTGPFQEWNMAGNPYPSGLDLNTIEWGQNTVQAAYIYDGCKANYVYWAKGLGTFNISPNSGFLVETTGEDVFSVTNENRAHEADWFWKDDVPNLLIMQASGNDNTDILYVRFADDVTAGFDMNGDAHKLIVSTQGMPQIYTCAGEELLAINALPETPSIPMGFVANDSGTYTISAIETSNFESVMLEDLFTGLQIDLLSDTYTFDYAIGDDPDRFVIYVITTGISETITSKTDIWISNRTINVRTAAADGIITVCNLAGQVILKTRLQRNLVNQISMANYSGCYIINVYCGDFSRSEKVFIR